MNLLIRYLFQFIQIKMLKVIVLSRQKELDVDPKAMEQVEFVEQLINADGVNADRIRSMFILATSEKKQRK